jgi:hypothetical protein
METLELLVVEVLVLLESLTPHQVGLLVQRVVLV